MQFNFTLENGCFFVLKAIKWKKNLLIVVYKFFVTFNAMLHVLVFSSSSKIGMVFCSPERRSGKVGKFCNSSTRCTSQIWKWLELYSSPIVAALVLPVQKEFSR